jgi:hypothetical protein
LCQTSSPQLAAFVSNGPTSAQYFRKTTEAYSQKLTFEVAEPSVFQATLSYSFFTGHLFFRLNGFNITSPYLSTPKDKTIYAWVGEDIAFFDHLLYPGVYEMVVDDEFSYPANASIPSFCTRFVLAYELKPGAPDNYCDDADTLPQDLFTPFVCVLSFLSHPSRAAASTLVDLKSPTVLFESLDNILCCLSTDPIPTSPSESANPVGSVLGRSLTTMITT